MQCVLDFLLRVMFLAHGGAGRDDHQGAHQTHRGKYRSGHLDLVPLLKVTACAEGTQPIMGSPPPELVRGAHRVEVGPLLEPHARDQTKLE